MVRSLSAGCRARVFESPKDGAAAPPLRRRLAIETTRLPSWTAVRSFVFLSGGHKIPARSTERGCTGDQRYCRCVAQPIRHPCRRMRPPRRGGAYRSPPGSIAPLSLYDALPQGLIVPKAVLCTDVSRTCFGINL